MKGIQGSQWLDEISNYALKNVGINVAEQNKLCCYNM